jgi:glycosyltransferase involved in cell wall biosynthesis
MVLSLTPFVLARIFNKPLITEINGDLLTEYQLAGFPQVWLAAIRMVERVVCRESHALICVTEGLAEIFQERYKLPGAKVKVIPNGTDTDRFHPLDRDACREWLGIEPTARVVGFVGTFLPHQGLDYLIQSARFIVDHSPEAVFLLVGDGPARKDIVAAIESMGLMHCFLLPGPVPPEKVVLFINAMDVCVAPFTRGRNERIGLSPLKIYDYLACGKPVVASDIRGVGEVLRENGVGIPARPEDPISLAQAVLSVLEDRHMAGGCLTKGPAVVGENFTWRIAAQKVADVCFQAL